MLAYGVLRDLPPLGLSFETIVLDDPAYATSSFNAHVDTSKYYATWFTESSVGPIIGDVPVSGSRVLGGIICAQVATRVEWRACKKVLQARVTELEATFAFREAHMQEETAQALAQERELWQKDREVQATLAERERSQFQSELATLHGYTILLMGELQTLHGYTILLAICCSMMYPLRGHVFFPCIL